MNAPVRNLLKSSAFLALTLCSLMLLYASSYLLKWGFRIHSTDVFYVDYPYFLYGGTWAAVGLFGISATVISVWRWELKQESLILVPMLAVLIFFTVPTDPRFLGGYADDDSSLRILQGDIGHWQEKHHAYPGSKSEFESAIKDAQPSGSPYRQRGQTIPYEFVIEPGAKGPHVSNISTKPGVIYYSVASDRREYWLTMTGLHTNLADAAILHSEDSRPGNHKRDPQIIHGHWRLTDVNAYRGAKTP
jgi:hypothetical protein